MLYTKDYDYKDTDITFHFRTYKDLDQAKWTFANIRRNFPQSRIMIISDGDRDIYPEDFPLHRVDFYPCENLTHIECGGKLIQRAVELFLKAPTKYFIKIDTDTGVHRRFNWLPKGRGMFGSLQSDGYINSIQGGFLGMDFTTVVDIYQSGICMSPLLEDYANTYALSPFVLSYCESRVKICEDFLYGYVAAKLGIPLFGFDEVKSNWKNYVENKNMRWAITHPCKDLIL